MILRFTDPRPVAPMTLAEARRMTRDPGFAARFDPATRMIAWRMVNDARRGRTCPVLVLITGTIGEGATEPPKDAA